VVSRKTRIGAAGGAILVFAAIVFGASLLILPHYVTTTRLNPDIEEASGHQFDTAPMVLTPKGMAAQALPATENLSSGPGTGR